MKKSKISLLVMTALLAIQAPAHAQDEPKKEPRTWGQFLDKNKWNIVAGTAVAGAGVVGYAFRNELIDAFNSMSPAKQEEMKVEVEKSLEQTEQVIEAQQEEIQKELAQVEEMNASGKHSASHNKQVAQKEKAIAEKQDAVAQLEQQVVKKASFLGWVTGQNSYQEYRNQVSADIDEQAALDTARNARREAESVDQDYRSSDDFRDDTDRAQYQKNEQKSLDQLSARKKLSNKYEKDKMEIINNSKEKQRKIENDFKRLKNSSLLNDNQRNIFEGKTSKKAELQRNELHKALSNLTNIQYIEKDNIKKRSIQHREDLQKSDTAIDNKYDEEPARTGGVLNDSQSPIDSTTAKELEGLV